jgi:hypothetical protein
MSDFFSHGEVLTAGATNNFLKYSVMKVLRFS